MAAVPVQISDIERLFGEAPQSADAWERAVASQRDTPKRLAERMIAENDAANRKWLRQYRDSIAGLIKLYAQGGAGEVLPAAVRLLSAHIDQTAAQIERDRIDAERVLESPPEGLPANAIRVITRGIGHAMTERHSALVDLYYQAVAALADKDETAKPSGKILSSVEGVGAYFSRLGGNRA